MSGDYRTVIGLEVHVQTATVSKMFCGCSTTFGAAANSQTCPVCLGFPGSLPVINAAVIELGIRIALALNCEIAPWTRFDRKNYFYPDLPKAYQISQFDQPLCQHGYLEIETDSEDRRIGVTRVHMEEDAGKLIHASDGSGSLVDYNRCGTPLLEIVSEPDLTHPDEAYAYLTVLKAIIEYLEVSDCNMEQGSLRCDANVSLAPLDAEQFGAKVEVKNLNSFKAVRAALAFEVHRQTAALDSGEHINQETRLWDEAAGRTRSMRSKEASHDYRYFPEPDLPTVQITEEQVAQVRASLPEMPRQRRERFVEAHGLSAYDAGVLTSSKVLADYFEDCLAVCPQPKALCNWITSQVMGYLNAHGQPIEAIGQLTPAQLGGLVTLVETGTINGKIAKQVLPELIETDAEPRALVESRRLVQISDEGALRDIVRQVIADNPDSIADYRAGKSKAMSFLVGGVMKTTKGQANPQMVSRLLEEELAETSGSKSS